MNVEQSSTMPATGAYTCKGYTWALSRATVPAIIEYGSGDEKTMLAQWRYQFVDGAAFSRPCCLVNAVSFGYLAYHGKFILICKFLIMTFMVAPDVTVFGMTSIRSLYILAAVSSASGVPWALTALRRTNGALSIRSKRLAGLFTASPSSEPMCITYASNEKGSLDREGKDPKYKTSKTLINRWKWHNNLRTVLLILGTIAGALAVSLDHA